MSKSQSHVSESDVRLEDLGRVDKIDFQNAHGITAITSAFANLTRGEAIRKFPRLYGTVLLTSFGAM